MKRQRQQIRTIIGLLCLVGAIAAHAVEGPPPSLGVSPSRIELEITGSTGTGSATVLNMSDRDIKVSTEVVNFELDEQGKFRQLPPDAGSLPGAIILNPVEFTIPANGSQIVRFAIMPERLDGAGEHRAMLFFSETVDTSHNALKMRFRLGTPIYATLGDVERTADLHRLAYQPAESRLEIDLTATGTAQVKPTGFYLYWPLADYPSEQKALARVTSLAEDPKGRLPKNAIGGRIMTKPVFPGSRRTIAASIPEPPDAGEYMLVYAVDVGGRMVQRAIEYVPSNVFIVDSD